MVEDAGSNPATLTAPHRANAHGPVWSARRKWKDATALSRPRRGCVDEGEEEDRGVWCWHHSESPKLALLSSILSAPADASVGTLASPGGCKPPARACRFDSCPGHCS